eukprot:m.106381 g.106381  ORF g.106381 m.106381 type:complete len:339 (+) comp27717_c0_seq2:277-1293(+)
MASKAQQGVYRSRTVEFMRYRGGNKQTSWDDNEGAESEQLIEDGYKSVAKMLPPEWVDFKEETANTLQTIQIKMKSLTTLHNDHINKPSFDGAMEQEQEIEIATSEITQLFHKCSKNIQMISKKGKQCTSGSQKTLAKNAAQAMAKEVQDLSMRFRKAQSSYLRRMRGQEDRSKSYGLGSSESTGAMEMFEEDPMDVSDSFTDGQIDKLKDNTNVVQERETEILNIVQSINELSEIFKDMAQLITEQGSILDRIDYNIGIAEDSVERGKENLEKAEKHQKSASKKYIILLLIVIVVGLLFAVMFKKKVAPGGGDATQAPPPPPPVTTAMPPATRMFLF